MLEREYLADACVAEFTAFLRGLIVEGYPGLALRVGTGNDRHDVSTLQEVVEAYRWRGQSFAAVNVKVESMRREMREALAQCEGAEGRAERRLAELELLFVSTKTLSWGRVYEGAFGFLIHQAETGVLAQNLRQAAALIDGGAEEVCAFDDRPFRSDCGMTKVYAAINERTVVYDDRLGAGLAFLCRRHLERNGRRRVPDLLAFMAGERGDSRRDPSRAGYRFSDKLAGREHARWNLRANWIISRLAAEPDVAALMGGNARDRLRRIEAALFMLGDDIRDQPASRARQESRPPRRVRRSTPTPADSGSATS